MGSRKNGWNKSSSVSIFFCKYKTVESNIEKRYMSGQDFTRLFSTLIKGTFELLGLARSKPKKALSFEFQAGSVCN
jgi:hypothetical protein